MGLIFDYIYLWNRTVRFDGRDVFAGPGLRYCVLHFVLDIPGFPGENGQLPKGTNKATRQDGG